MAIEYLVSPYTGSRCFSVTIVLFDYGYGKTVMTSAHNDGLITFKEGASARQVYTSQVELSRRNRFTRILFVILCHPQTERLGCTASIHVGDRAVDGWNDGVSAGSYIATTHL